MNQRANATEYLLALKTIKRFKTLLLLLILLTLLYQVSSFILVEFTSLVDLPQWTSRVGSADSRPAEVATGAVENAKRLYSQALNWTLPITKFIALASTTVLVLCLICAGQLALLAGGTGARQMVGAFCWSLILLAMVIPWQQVYQSCKACGALYSLGELVGLYDAFHVSPPTVSDRILYYGRFLGYPGLALLVWLMTAIRFAGGYRRLTSAPAATA
jgi:hypothetical protein